jgi:DNA repair protein RadC
MTTETKPKRTRKAAQTIQVQSTDPAPYRVTPPDEEGIITAALSILEGRLKKPGALFDAPQAVKAFLRLRLGQREDQLREVFTVLYLDSQHCLLAAADEFTGTLTQASIYPREIARTALKIGAASVVLSHNHPSGVSEPSSADRHLTRTLKDSLALVDVRVLDHFIVTLSECRSMAEMGLV